MATASSRLVILPRSPPRAAWLTRMQNLAYYVRTHEKALANSLQQRQSPRNTQASTPQPSQAATSPQPSASALVASALTFGYLGSASQSAKPAKLYLTPNQLYYLLSRFDELGVATGPMNVRLENIHAESSSANYVSFLTNIPRSKTRTSDQDSIHSVSSIRSVMSNVSSMWTGFSFPSTSAAKLERQKAAILEDLRYLYSAFTKIPCLKLANDYRVPRISGFEEFPFDTAVPIYVFKNLHTLEIMDVDFRTFFGWDRVADHVRHLTVKRAALDDPADLLTNVVLDDMDKRRRRSAKGSSSPIISHIAASPTKKSSDFTRSYSKSASPPAAGRVASNEDVGGNETETAERLLINNRLRSLSPSRPTTSRKVSSRRNIKIRRSSASSTSSGTAQTPRTSSSNLLSLGYLPPSKWHFLRHLSLADNGLTSISTISLAPIAPTLQSLDLSANLFTEVPDSLATLMSLRALNLGDCLIDSLRSLSRNPLPAITTLSLRGNKIVSLAGVEKLLSLERLDLRDNKMTDPAELARLTGMPEFREVFVLKNPFVRTHPAYRITIFNAFRKTPGYTEDVIIDTTGPGYNERRSLVDRVPERVSVPVVRVMPEDDTSAELTKQQDDADDYFSKAHSESQADIDTPQTPSSPMLYQSQRRKKGARRRIVDISQNEPPWPEVGSTTSTLPRIEAVNGEKDVDPADAIGATVTHHHNIPVNIIVPSSRKLGSAAVQHSP